MLSMSVKVEHAVTIRDGSHCAGAASPDDMRSKDGRVRALPWPRLREGYLSPGLFILLGIPRDFDGGEGGGYVGGEPIERMMSMRCVHSLQTTRPGRGSLGRAGRAPLDRTLYFRRPLAPRRATY